MRKPKAILFDFGDTVVHVAELNFDRGFQRILQLVSNRGCINLAEAVAVRDELQDTITAAHEAPGIEFPVSWIVRLLTDRLGLHLALTREEVDQEMWHASHRFAPAPGVATALSALSERGIPVAMVSNCAFPAPLLEQELARHDLLEPFTFVLSSTDYGLCKPHPAMFLAAARRLGVEPRETWVIGDKLHVDVAGAHRAGMTGIWYTGLVRSVPEDQACPEPDAELRDWRDLPELLA